MCAAWLPALHLNASSACGVHISPPPTCLWSPPPSSCCVCSPLAWRATLTLLCFAFIPLPPPSQVPCAHCVWFHLACLSCTHVLHTPHGHPHVQPTPPYGCYRAMLILYDDGTMPTWTCNGVCCGGFVQAHTARHHQAALTYMIPSPYTRPRIWYHLACIPRFPPPHICRQRGVRTMGRLLHVQAW